MAEGSIIDHDEVLSKLNKLYSITHTGAEGYRQAAEQIEVEEVKTLFNMLASQRAQMVSEISQHIQAQGGEVEPKPLVEVAADVHQGWLNLRGVLSGGDAKMILQEVERGEKQALNAFEDALATPMPESVYQSVHQQYHTVQDAYQRAVTLKEMAKSA